MDLRELVEGCMDKPGICLSSIHLVNLVAVNWFCFVNTIIDNCQAV